MTTLIWLFVVVADVLSNDVDIPEGVNMALALIVGLLAFEDKARIKRWLKR